MHDRGETFPGLLKLDLRLGDLLHAASVDAALAILFEGEALNRNRIQYQATIGWDPGVARVTRGKVRAQARLAEFAAERGSLAAIVIGG